MEKVARNSELLIKYREHVHIGAFITRKELAMLTGATPITVAHAASRYKWEAMPNVGGIIAYHADRGEMSPLEWVEAWRKTGGKLRGKRPKL